MYDHIAIIGSTGTIGSALTAHLSGLYPEARISTISRRFQAGQNNRFHHFEIDYNIEASIEKAANQASQHIPFNLVIVATGVLHDGDKIQPEKSLKDLSAEKFQAVFNANTVFPALVAKHFLPKMNKEKKSVFAVLSARVGSISDNQLGGWYAYRASKAALNMIVKNAAIEMGRRNKELIVVALHPGTVDSPLSIPFQTNVKEGKLFTPDFSAQNLVSTINNLTSQDSGKCFAWDKQEILP